jgi:hypothetical protein
VSFRITGPLTLLGTLYAAAKTVGIGPVPKRRPRWTPPEEPEKPEALRLAEGLIGYAEATSRARHARMALAAVEAAEASLGKDICQEVRFRVDQLCRKLPPTR